MFRIACAMVCVALAVPEVAGGTPAAGSIAWLLSAIQIATTCPAWSRVQTLSVSGSLLNDDGTMSGTFDERIDTRSGRFRLRETDGPYRTIEGFDGTYEWARDESAGSHRYDSPHALALARSDAWLLRRGWCDGNAATYASLGPARVDGHDADLVSALPTGGVPMVLAIDRGTHLPLRATVRQNENSLVTEFTDWRMAGTVIFPYGISLIDREDDDSQRFAVNRLATGSLSNGVFAMPSTTFDVAIAGGGSTARIPYTYDGQKVLVDVTLDGRGPFPFVLDTGGHFIVTARTAALLGRKPVRGRLHVGELRIGPVVVRDQVAEYKRQSYQKVERGPRPPKAGWLGLQLLEDFAVTIDPRVHVVTLRRLDRPRPIPQGRRILMTLDQDAPLVDCAIDGFGGPCMIDTGNASPTIVEGYWAASTTLPRRLGRSGIPRGHAVDARASVSVAGFQSPREVVRLYPQESDGSESTTVEAAIFGERFLNRFVLTVDLGRHAAWFAPIPGVPSAPYDRAGIVAEKEPDGTFLVRATISKSPAALAGFVRGDRISDVDDVAAARLSLYDLLALDSARPGTVRVYRVIRANRSIRITVRLRELL